MSDYRVYFDRVPNRDQFALYITRSWGDHGGSGSPSSRPGSRRRSTDELP